MRAAVLARDGGRCQLELPGCAVTATCVHHTLGRSVSGDKPEFLLAACQSCNLQLGDPSSSDPEPTPRTRW